MTTGDKVRISNNVMAGFMPAIHVLLNGAPSVEDDGFTRPSARNRNPLPA